jgi:hypothetical protein
VLSSEDSKIAISGLVRLLIFLSFLVLVGALTFTVGEWQDYYSNYSTKIWLIVGSIPPLFVLYTIIEIRLNKRAMNEWAENHDLEIISYSEMSVFNSPIMFRRLFTNQWRVVVKNIKQDQDVYLLNFGNRPGGLIYEYEKLQNSEIAK